MSKKQKQEKFNEEIRNAKKLGIKSHYTAFLLWRCEMAGILSENKK